MSNKKLKLNMFHESRVWYWYCPKCDYLNEEDSDPKHFDGFDEEMGEYFECVGCYDLFDLDKGE